MAEQINKQEQDILQLTQQQASRIVAVLLITGFFIFMIGYYIGRRTGYAAALSDATVSVFPRINNTISPLNDHDVQHNTQEGEDVQQKQEQKNEVHEQYEPEISNVMRKQYCGQLAGFGTYKAAHKYLQDIQHKGFDARLVERHSKTAAGEQRTWYQVTTHYFDNQEQLNAHIKRMQKVRLCQAVEVVAVNK